MPINALPSPSRRVRRLACFVLGLLAVAWLAVPARADFSGPYDLSPAQNYFGRQPASQPVGTWTLTYSAYGFPMSGFSATSAPSTIYFDTGDAFDTSAISGDGIALELTNTAVATGTLSFDYSIGELNIYNDHAGYTINGTRFALPAANGSVSGVTLKAGDTFGFYVTAGPASLFEKMRSGTYLAVSAFNAPVIPEPTACGWLALGLASYGWRRLRARPRRVHVGE